MEQQSETERRAVQEQMYQNAVNLNAIAHGAPEVIHHHHYHHYPAQAPSQAPAPQAQPQTPTYLPNVTVQIKVSPQPQPREIYFEDILYHTYVASKKLERLYAPHYSILTGYGGGYMSSPIGVSLTPFNGFSFTQNIDVRQNPLGFPMPWTQYS